MITKTLKKLGNSKCLSLDKTLLNILGIEFEDESITVSIDGNRLIIEKTPVLEDKTQFILNEEQWDSFNQKLNLKPDLANLSKLLHEKGVLDE